jgi:hypothetical protein
VPPATPLSDHPAHRRWRRLAAVALLVVTTLAGCTVADDPVAVVRPGAGFGTVQGQWNDTSWSGLGYAVLHDDTLEIVGHRPDPRYYYDEYVRARVAFRGVGHYQVDAEEGSLRQITGGDAGHFPRSTGELRVGEYDAAAGRVRGTLALVSVEAHLPWRFEYGRFDVPVYAHWADVPPPPAR